MVKNVCSGDRLYGFESLGNPMRSIKSHGVVAGWIVVCLGQFVACSKHSINTSYYHHCYIFFQFKIPDS